MDFFPNAIPPTSASLSFAVKKQSETTVTIHNTLGQQIATVYEGTDRPESSKRLRLM